MSDQKHLAFAVASWLSLQASSSSESTKLLEASKNVCDAFDLNLQDPSQRATYGSGPGLKNVWDVFVKTQAKMGAGSSTGNSSASTSEEPSAETKAKAETLKADGNKAMSAKDYGAAITAYSQAIDLHAKNPVYFSNRSAAYAQVGQHDKAIEDAREASNVDPKFSKAYSRLGHALFSSGRYEEAVEAYETGVELDPTNSVMKSGLETARQHAQDQKKPTSPPPSASRDVGGAANGGMGGLPGMGGGAGGMPDLSSLMNNPMIAQMAQSMMANGGLDQMMNNPMIQQMMSRFGGGGGGAGGGGMPDINAMMQDPQMREMARNFMGGAGGAGRGGAAPGGGSGSTGSGGSNAGDDMFS